MKLEGRRVSTNVEDRRGKGTVAKAGGLGLGGIIVAVIVLAKPRFSKIGLSILPKAFKSSKFCIFRAPT